MIRRLFAYWLFNTNPRRLLYLIAAIVFAIFSIFPRPYTARAKLLPQDSSSAGLSQLLTSLSGQLSAFANLLGNGRPPHELYLIIGRGDKTMQGVIQKLKLVGPNARYQTIEEAKLALIKQMDIHLLLGGVLEVQSKTHDPAESLRLTEAFISEISQNVAGLGRTTIASKRKIVNRRTAEARTQVQDAERALSNFRRENRLADAESQLGGELSLRAQIQGKLQAKQLELNTVRQYATADNFQLATVQSEVAALQAQLARASVPASTTNGPNAFGLSTISGQYFDLYRDYRFAQAVYDVYARANEQVSVEELVAEQATYIQMVEPTHLDAERSYNNWAIGMLVLLALMVVFTELYAPATGLRWPAGPERRDDVA